MNIILMRHGQAEHYQYTDRDRKLTEFGYQQAQQTAHHILQHHTPELFVVSPYERAKKTLEAYTELAPSTKVQVLNDITPEDNATQALDSLYQLVEKTGVKSILVVCHMPIVAHMAHILTGGQIDSYALAEARVIQCDAVVANLGELVDTFIPKQI